MVSVCADITPARSLRFDSFRYKPVLTGTPVFRLWEQEAGSSNLPTPTSVDGAVADEPSARCVDVSRMYQASYRSTSSASVERDILGGRCDCPMSTHGPGSELDVRK